ncbi:MAG: GNAT family N-acetyltransferase [Saprospiraceae bacterium]|nr:GNAT family N-acetyltransferase [Saprospiraceae bacterium]
MEILNCIPSDADAILNLYQAARNLQAERNMVVWPIFEKSFIMREIEAQRHWKIVVDDTIACNWAITFEDKDIWEEKDKNDAIYIHRIATHPDFRGNRYIDAIVGWAKNYAASSGKNYVRLDTLGNNVKLINHYTSSGFRFLGIYQLSNTAQLPAHYQREPDCCLFELLV